MAFEQFRGIAIEGLHEKDRLARYSGPYIGCFGGSFVALFTAAARRRTIDST